MKQRKTLLEADPVIIEEWDYEKNKAEGFSLENTAYACNKKRHWICSVCGHKWQATPSHRTNPKQPTGCPCCAMKKIGSMRAKQAAEKNNLVVNFPLIAAEWHPTRNNLLKAEDVACFSNKKVWWKCSYCHKEWMDSVNHRTGRGSACPFCSTVGTSFSEQAVYYYISQVFPDAQNRAIVDLMEYDVYVPSKKIAIEYDGAFYHRHKDKQDNKKNVYCKENNITLYRLREKGLQKFDNCICIFSNSRNLSPAIQKLIDCICPENSIVVAVDDDRSKIIENFRIVSQKNSIAKKYPNLLLEWHPTRNGDISPDTLSVGSDIKVYWKCNKCGFEWKASISHRVNGRNCPACAGIVVVEGINDLQTLDPEIAMNWAYEKNVSVLPSQVAVKSNKKYWWKCEKGHYWETSPSGRRIKGKLVGCPYCANYYVLTGFNDLQTKYPQIAKEWHPIKNGKITPDKIVFGTNDKYWWKCNVCGGEWEAQVTSRIGGCGCPYCKGHHVLEGFNDLGTTHPMLAKQWHPTKNEGLRPQNVRYGSNKNVWWKCTHCGCEWKAMIKVRSRGSLCPKCRKAP